MGAIQQVIASYGGSANADPYSSYVVSLLNMSGTNGSTTFTDTIGKVWTANGNAQISTALGYNTALFDGTGDNVTTPHHADFDFSGGGDWVMEAWVYVTLGADRGILSHRSGANGFAWEIRSTGAVWMRADIGGYSDTKITTAAGAVSASTLTHVSVAKSGTAYAIAVGGSIAGTLTSASNLGSVGVPLRMGRSADGTDEDPYSGHIKALRISKGTSRGYTSTFTPPAAPFAYP